MNGRSKRSERGGMGKRQKLILILYVNVVIIISFLYVPYIQHFSNGVMRFAGHRLRFRIWDLTPWERASLGNATIDANLIIAEVLAITAIAVVMYLLCKRDQ